MAYDGEPLAQLITMGPRSTVDMLRTNPTSLGQPADRIHRANGQPLGDGELDAALAVVEDHLRRAEEAVADYLLAPRFSPGQRVDLYADDGERILRHDVIVRTVQDRWTVEIVDDRGRHDIVSATSLHPASAQSGQ